VNSPEPAPDISVVVPSVNGWSDLEGCLAALFAQENGVGVEVLVADRLGSTLRELVRERFPRARVLEAPAGTSIPRLRAMAFAAARAPVVGVVEDHVLVPGDWASRMLAAHREGAQAVGGAVANAADGRYVDVAAFLCEYSHCLTPPAAGPSAWLTGNNVTYRRELLERFRSVVEREGWENQLHDAIRDSGVPLMSRPEIVVGHKKHYTVWEYTSQRFLYSRAWAGLRVRDAGPLRRAAWGLAAFALPPVLLARIVGNVRRAGAHHGALARSLPLLVLWVAAWAAGEVVGYWFGAGDALGKVR
jgi:phosphoribosylcarboxyaminoimidazole (NCAIR) mutase